MGHRVWSCGGRGHAHKGARTGNAIPSLCVCLVGGRAKSVEETRISNTARLHYLHAAHKTQFVPQHWFNPFSSGPRTHTQRTANDTKRLSWGIFLNFPLGFSWHFPSWSCVLGIIMNISTPPPRNSAHSIHFHLLIWSALSTLLPSSFTLFRFSDFPFSARLGQSRHLERGKSKLCFYASLCGKQYLLKYPLQTVGQ